MKRVLPVILAVGLLLVLVLVVGGLFIDWLQEFLIVRSFDALVENLAQATHQSVNLIKAIVVLVAIPFVFALRETGQLPLWRPTKRWPKEAAWGVVAICLSGFFFAKHYFRGRAGIGGQCQRWYATDPTGRFVECGTAGVNPTYGTKCVCLDTCQLAILARQESGEKPRRIALTFIDDITARDTDGQEVRFFDANQCPQAWYYRATSGRIDLYNMPGRGLANEPMEPITSTVLRELAANFAVQQEIELKDKFRIEADRAAAEERRKRETERTQNAEAAARRLARLNDVLPDHSANIEGRLDVAIAVVNENGGLDLVTAHLLKKIISGERGAAIQWRDLGSYFQSSAHFGSVFAGRTEELKDLNLGKYIDRILLVEKRTRPEHTGYANIVSVETTLDVRVLDPTTWQSAGQTETAKGAGRSQAEAQAQSIEMLGARVAEMIS